MVMAAFHRRSLIVTACLFQAIAASCSEDKPTAGLTTEMALEIANAVDRGVAASQDADYSDRHKFRWLLAAEEVRHRAKNLEAYRDSPPFVVDARWFPAQERDKYGLIRVTVIRTGADIDAIEVAWEENGAPRSSMGTYDSRRGLYYYPLGLEATFRREPDTPDRILDVPRTGRMWIRVIDEAGRASRYVEIARKSG